MISGFAALPRLPPWCGRRRSWGCNWALVLTAVLAMAGLQAEGALVDHTGIARTCVTTQCLGTSPKAESGAWESATPILKAARP